MSLPVVHRQNGTTCSRALWQAEAIPQHGVVVGNFIMILGAPREVVVGQLLAEHKPRAGDLLAIVHGEEESEVVALNFSQLP